MRSVILNYFHCRNVLIFWWNSPNYSEKWRKYKWDFENKWSIFIFKIFKLQRVLQQDLPWIFRCISINNLFPVKFNISMEVHQDKCVESVFSHTITKVRLYITQWWICPLYSGTRWSCCQKNCQDSSDVGKHLTDFLFQ